MRAIGIRKGSLAVGGLAVLLLLVLTLSAATAEIAYTWWNIRDNTAGRGSALTATDADHVWGVASKKPAQGGTVIFSTANASAAVPTWTEKTVEGAYLSGMFALDNDHVWAAGGDADGTGDNTSAIYCWNPGADTWDRQNNGGTAYQLNGAAALSATQAWVCGNNADNKGVILFSNGGAYNSGDDGGSTPWVDEFVDPTDNGSPIKRLSAAGSTVWAVGYEGNDGKIFKRLGPNDWRLQYTETGNRIYDVKALDDNRAWACGRNGIVLYTTDGGENWNELTTPGTTGLNAVTATDMNNVWVGGNEGVVWAWNGSAWDEKVLPQPEATAAQDAVSPDNDHVYFLTGGGTTNRVFRKSSVSIASCTPAWGAQGQTRNVTITGNNTHFVDGASAATFSGAGITVNSTKVVSPTRATANVTIAQDARPGPRNVNVITTGATPAASETPDPLAGGFTVRATWFIDTKAGPHGKITPAGPVKVIDGDSKAFTITPDKGYHVVDVAVDGLHLGAVDGYTFRNVKANHLIEATFSDQYSTWYLPEGSTAWGFRSYIQIQNPNDADLNARVTYMLTDGKTRELTVGLPKMSQVSVAPEETIGQADFSTRVECVQGKTIAVDRGMVWQSGAGNAIGTHNSIGVTAPSTNWYLPEGSSNWGFQTWLLIQNPNEVEASCDVTYMIEGVGPKVINHIVPAQSRATYNMEEEVGGADASIQVASNIGVIPERAMYTFWPEGESYENPRREGHDSVGVTRAAREFYLAEGTTAWGFTTYVLVENPNDTEVDVTMTYMTNEGPVADAPFKMPAKSRKTVRVNDAHPDMDLSTLVRATKPIVAERSMYWAAPDVNGQATHDSIGTDAAHATWFLPDGGTSPDDGGLETFTLVQNPNKSDVEVRISYLGNGGTENVVFTDVIPGNSRRTYNMADKYGADADASASIMVESLTAGKKVIAERAIYTNGRWGGNCSIGGYDD